MIENGQYIFTTKPSERDKRKQPGREELVSVLDTAIQNGVPSYAIKCIALDISAHPRKIASFDSDFLMDIRIIRIGEDYIGKIVGYTPPRVVKARNENNAWIASTAINDIDQDYIGYSDPEYVKRMSGSYIRDQRIRDLVLKRANGICEECSKPGFIKSDGSVYLETHHVISLSEEGEDKLHNVIALCATDHRRAHFSAEWEMMQHVFITKLSKYKSDS